MPWMCWLIQHLAVASVQRVVEHGRVQPDLHPGVDQRAVEGGCVADLCGHRVVDTLVVATLVDVRAPPGIGSEDAAPRAGPPGTRALSVVALTGLEDHPQHFRPGLRPTVTNRRQQPQKPGANPDPISPASTPCSRFAPEVRAQARSRPNTKIKERSTEDRLYGRYSQIKTQIGRHPPQRMPPDLAGGTTGGTTGFEPATP
jgi:hypothetical protein